MQKATSVEEEKNSEPSQPEFAFDSTKGD